MARFKVTIQIYRDFIIEANTDNEAMEMARQQATPNLLPTDRININSPRNLDKKKPFKKHE